MAQLDTDFRSLIECSLRLVPPAIFAEMAVASAERRERAMRQMVDIILMNLTNLRHHTPSEGSDRLQPPPRAHGIQASGISDKK